MLHVGPNSWWFDSRIETVDTGKDFEDCPFVTLQP